MGRTVNIIEILKDRIQGKAPKGARRSKDWKKVRKDYLRKNPFCYICESNEKLEVHHKLPFFLMPDLELDQNNLITLCDKRNIGCHFVFGHLKSWKSFNINIDLDVTIWNQKIKNRP